MIYNKDNNITTAISLSGDVEFENKLIDYQEVKQVTIKAGEFSTVVPNKNDLALSPTKMSPKQFKALINNPDLRLKSNKINRVLQKQKKQKNKIQESINKNNQENIPQEFLGPGYTQVVGNLTEMDEYTRPGGYIDLKTGIYIEPPVDAQFNKDEGVFEVYDELGGLIQQPESMFLHLEFFSIH